MRSIHAALLAFALAPVAASAGEVMSTAPASQTQPATPAVAPLQVADDGEGGGSVRQVMGPCGPESVDDNGKVATKAHGFVEAGVGTGGYRHLAGGVCKPLANGGAIAVSVSESQGQGRRYDP